MNFILKNIKHLLKHYKMSSVINILGLSVSFAVFIVVAIQMYYDFTYNRSFEKADNIYLFSYYKSTEKVRSPWISIPNAKDMAAKFPEVKSYTTVSLEGSIAPQIDVKTEDGNLQMFEVPIRSASPGFLDVFTPHILHGNAADALVSDGRLLIPAKTAIKLFGTEDAVGKTVFGHFSKKEYTIAAVYKDFPKNSTIVSACYTYQPDNSRENSNYFMYLELEPNTATSLQEKLNSKEFLGEDFIKFMEEQPDNKIELQLIPFYDLHLYVEYLRDGNINTTLSLLAIGILILVIAFINLLNISMAMVPSRIKTLNTHKILGINNSFLRLGLALEGTFLALISFILALIYIQIFSESTLAEFFQADISLSVNIWTILVIALSLLLITFFVNLYPAIYATSFKMDTALKGSFSLSAKSNKIRNILITIQFIVAIVLIIISGFIKIQQNYMQNYDLGIEKENIAFLPIHGLKTDYNTFGKELTGNSHIIDYTASQFIPGYIGMGWGRNLNGKQVNFSSWPVAPNFLKFFGIKVIEGNNFSEENPSGLEQIVFNSEFMKKYELDSSIIGKDFECFNKGTIVGIISDFNFESLRNPIRPMAFVILNGKDMLNYMFIKVSGENLPEDVKYIEQTWKKFSDDEFNLTFLNSRLNDLYKNENNMAKLIGLFGIITVVIAIMGVYGLVSFNTRYKQREIAIRKVNGSTVEEIIVLLNRNLLLQLIISYVIAIPIAYYIIQQWLDQFAYKAPIPWWLFLSAGILILIISAITVSWQSWKAATINPVDAIKNE